MKLIGQVSLARGQLVNPNFAQTIEFSTKFSETPLRKLILLTERLSVEIANFLPLICVNSTFDKYFGEKLSNIKSEIVDLSDEFKFPLDLMQTKDCFLFFLVFFQNSFQVTTDAF